MIGQQIAGIAGDPLRQIDGLIVAGVKPYQDAALCRAGILNGMAVALRNEGYIALRQVFDPIAAMRAEQSDVKIAGDDVLPFIGVRVSLITKNSADRRRFRA